MLFENNCYASDSLTRQAKKKPVKPKFNGLCGERGIRTPEPVTVNGFQDRRVRPLCHLSGVKIR